MNAWRLEGLVEPLLDADCLLDPDRRRQLCNRLPVAIRHQSKVWAAPDVFVRDLVDIAWKRNLLGYLLRWIDWMDSSSSSARTAREKAAPLIHEEELEALASVLGHLPEGEAYQVRSWLEEVDFAEVEDLYARFFQRHNGFCPPDPSTVWEALTDCAMMSRRLDGGHPLSGFCQELAHRCGPGLEGRLSSWARRGGAPSRSGTSLGREEPLELGVSTSSGVLGQRDPGRRRSAGERTPARIIILVRRSGQRGHLLVEHWIALRNRPQEPEGFHEHGLPETLPQHRIGTRVCELISYLESDTRRKHHSGVRVEWVLSLELIRELRAEEWQQAMVLSDSEGDARVGARAQVIYRLEDVIRPARSEHKEAREACELRWERLERAGRGHILDMAEGGCVAVSDITSEHLSRDDLAIVEIGNSSRGEWFQEVRSAVTVGIPVVVWRSKTNNSRVGVASGVSGDGGEGPVPLDRIRMLPSLIHDSRKGRVGAGDTGYIENSFGLAVIYHDSQPVLPPPSVPLSVASIQ